MHQIYGRIKIFLSLFAMGATSIAQGTVDNSRCVIAGPRDAQLTIEEFADFECKYCVRGSNTMREVLKHYPGKINLVFRNLPLAAHPNAMLAAKAFSAVCLQDPSLAYSYQKEIFDNQDKFHETGEPFLYEAANKIGVDLNRMKTDMNGEVVANSISEDQRLAELNNFGGTPSFLIGTERIVGARSFDEIREVIDRQLRK